MNQNTNTDTKPSLGNPFSSSARKIFWFNGGLLALSLVADGLKETFPQMEQFGFTSTFLPQFALFMFTVFIATILDAIHSSNSSIIGETKITRQSLRADIEEIEARSEKFRKDLAKGIVEYGGVAYRSLRYDPTQGCIYYGEADTDNRNILFNNETFKKILQTAQSEYQEHIQSDNVRDTLLYKLGYSASSRFAKHFQKHLETQHIAFALTSWLKAWTSYDSDAGFGKMEVRPISAEHETAQVVIHQSFLTHGHDYGGNRSLCGFMIGYIEGLLKNFAAALYHEEGLDREGIQVQHDFERECYHGHQNPDIGCIFWVIAPKLPARREGETNLA